MPQIRTHIIGKTVYRKTHKKFVRFIIATLLWTLPFDLTFKYIYYITYINALKVSRKQGKTGRKTMAEKWHCHQKVWHCYRK